MCVSEITEKHMTNWTEKKKAYAREYIKDWDCVEAGVRAGCPHDGPWLIKQADVQAEIQRLLTDAVGPLTKALKDPDSGVRQEAAYSLMQIEDAVAVEPMIEALRNEDVTVRCDAAIYLTRYPDPRALIPLGECLEDEDVELRRHVVEALGRIAHDDTIEYLLNALRDDDEIVRRNAAVAISRVPRQQDTVGALRHTVANTQIVREYFAASYALAKIGDGVGIAGVLEELFDSPRHLPSQPYQVEEARETLRSFVGNSRLTNEVIDLAIEASGYGTETTAIDGGLTSKTTPSLENGSKAIRQLCDIDSPISSNILYLVTKKGMVTLKLMTGECCNTYYLTFDDQKKVAAEELGHRGFARYDPSAYYG